MRCSPESVETFSAVAYAFGRELPEELRVPIGLMPADWTILSGSDDTETFVASLIEDGVLVAAANDASNRDA